MNNEHKHARRETPAMQVFAKFMWPAAVCEEYY